jgi:glutathione S-transferase
MPHPILYGNRQSGHSYKVKLALTVLGTKHEYREVDLAVPLEQRSEDFRAASVFGEVPVFVEGELRIVQSNAILLHLARQSGRLGGELDPNLLAQWLFWEANRIGISVPNLRAMIYHGDQPPSAVPAWLRARALADLSRLDGELASRPFILGSALTVVDIACCGYLFWPEQAGLDLKDWPHVIAWLDRIRAIPGWAAPYDLLKENGAG